MAESKDEERDEEWFKEVYGKEYTGPPRPANENARDNPNVKKRPIAQTNSSAGESDEDGETPDPNAVPTDFTSREAKVWEAKAKAIEKNWKKKKEEELICRICGEYGHFSQGCPTTLGSNRKQGEIVERIPVKDKRLKPRIIGTGGAIIQGIEKDTGCRLQLEDNLTEGNGAFFVRVLGSNRVMVGKAVEAVKKVLDQVQEDWKQQNPRRPQGSHHRGSNVNPLIAAQMQHIANQRMQHNSNMQPHPGQADGPFGEERQIANQLEARRQWEHDNQNGSFSVAPYGHKGGSHYIDQNQDHRTNMEKESGITKDQDLAPDMESGYGQQSMPQTLEALEHRFVQETMELTKELNDAEDKESARHRERMRSIREQYQQNMVTLRAQQAKYREDFLRRESQLRQQQYEHHQQQTGSNYYNYNLSRPMSGFNSGVHDQIGHRIGSADRNEVFGGYGSHKGEGPYYNASHGFNRNPGYDAGMLHPGNHGYDSGPYRY